MRRLLTSMAASLLAAIGAFAPASPALADDIRNGQWHLSTLEVAKAHQISQGEGITVAVIDTGVKAEHPDLSGNVLPGLDVVPGGSGNGWGDALGHGTSMVGLIVAHGHGAGNGDGAMGIAPKAKVLPIRIAINDETVRDSTAFAKGVDEAVKRGAKIISIAQKTTAGPAYDAVQRAIKAGVIVVAFSGNRPQEEFISDPGAWPGVVTVGAIGKDGNVANETTRGRAMVLSAPGVDIVSTGIRGTGAGYRIGTGTSPATSIVSGVAALVWSKYPNLTATQVIDHMTATATDKGAPGRDEEYGFGMVNPVKALSTQPSFAPSVGPTVSGNQLPPRTTPRAGDEDDSGNTWLFVAIGAVLVVIAVVALIAFTRRRS